MSLPTEGRFAAHLAEKMATGKTLIDQIVEIYIEKIVKIMKLCGRKGLVLLEEMNIVPSALSPVARVLTVP